MKSSKVDPSPSSVTFLLCFTPCSSVNANINPLPPTNGVPDPTSTLPVVDPVFSPNEKPATPQGPISNALSPAVAPEYKTSNAILEYTPLNV